METLLTRRQISARVAALGRQIDADYRDRPLTVVALMTGGLVFAADLIRAINTPLWVDSVGVSSYRGRESSGELKFRSELKLPVAGRHVLLVDEVFDSGLTLRLLREHFAALGALSVRAAAAVVKTAPRAPECVEPEYVGFTLPDRFLIGYGMDCEENGRQYPFIGALD